MLSFLLSILQQEHFINPKIAAAATSRDPPPQMEVGTINRF